jgi:hypothetical protein
VPTDEGQLSSDALEAGPDEVVGKEDFEDEIHKSLAEYVEQVGRKLADSKDYFENALNEILAGGHQIF